MRFLGTHLGRPKSGRRLALGGVLVLVTLATAQGCGSDAPVAVYGFAVEADPASSELDLVVTHGCALPRLDVRVGESGTAVSILITGKPTTCSERGASQERLRITLAEPLGDRSVFDLSCDVGDPALRCDRRSD
jgi:hypothetical protein